MSQDKHASVYKKIGKNIAKFRKNKGYTQEEFANEIGISYSYLTQIEAPNVVTKMSLEVLKIDIKELF